MRIFALSLLAQVVFLSLPFAWAQFPLHSDFEDPLFHQGSLGGQQGWSVQQGVVEVRDQAGRDQSRGMVIIPSLPFGQASYLLDSPSAAPVVFIDLWLRPIASSATEDAQFLDADGVVAGFFRLGLSGRLEAMNGNGQMGGEWVAIETEYALGESNTSLAWLRLTLRLDFAPERRGWDLYVDGRLQAADLGFWDDSAAGFQRLSFMGNAESSLHIDDVCVDESNPLFTDADKDGLPDAWESQMGLDPTVHDRGSELAGAEPTSALQAYMNGEPGMRWPTLGLSGIVGDQTILDHVVLSVPFVVTHPPSQEDRYALLEVIEPYARRQTPEDVTREAMNQGMRQIFAP